MQNYYKTICLFTLNTKRDSKRARNDIEKGFVLLLSNIKIIKIKRLNAMALYYSLYSNTDTLLLLHLVLAIIKRKHVQGNNGKLLHTRILVLFSQIHTHTQKEREEDKT